MATTDRKSIDAPDGYNVYDFYDGTRYLGEDVHGVGVEATFENGECVEANWYATSIARWHLTSADTPRASHCAYYELFGIRYQIFATHDRTVGTALCQPGYPNYQEVCTVDKPGITAAERAAEEYVDRIGGRFV